jgi:hypothetical protein
MTYLDEFLARTQLAIKALGSVFSGLSTGAAVPARDVAATLIGIPVILWLIFLVAKPRRRTVRR